MAVLTILRTNLRCSALSSRDLTASGLFKGVAGRCMSVLVKQKPGREGEDDHEARVDERSRTEISFQVANLQDPVGNERQRQPAQDADHPGRKVRAEDIDR